jgi:hypothetical protein
MLDLAVEFGALVTHFRFRIPAKLAAIIVAEQTIERLICSGGKFRTLLKPTEDRRSTSVAATADQSRSHVLGQARKPFATPASRPL